MSWTLKKPAVPCVNGANIVVVNLVRPGDPWQGISTEEDIASIASNFLESVQ